MSELMQVIRRDEGGGVIVLTLNRPEKYNAFTGEMISQWLQELEAFEKDPEARVLILTGAGKAFCAGGDAEGMQRRTEGDALQRKHYLWRHVHHVALLMERLDKPVIAAINGTARGAGMDMALMCDLRLMARGATMAESYIHLGLIAGDGGTYYLPRLIGVARALELFWTGREVGADEARELGLVIGVSEPDKLLADAIALARRIAAQPAEAVRAYKRATYQGLQMPLGAHLDMVSSHMAVLRDSEEHRERVAQFVERRRASRAERETAASQEEQRP